MLAECRHTLVGPYRSPPPKTLTELHRYKRVRDDGRGFKKKKIFPTSTVIYERLYACFFTFEKKMMLRFSGEEKSHDVVAKYAMSFLLLFSFVTQVVSWLADKCEMRSLWAISLLDVAYLNVRTTNVITDSYFRSTNRLQLRDVFSVSVSPRCQDEIWGIA